MATNKSKKEETHSRKINGIDEKKKKPNYVIMDKIMREIVEKEIVSQIRFEQYWSCLKAENLEKVYREIFKESSIDTDSRQLPSTYSCSRKKLINLANLNMHSIPPRSSELYGWKLESHSTLEIFGPSYVSPKQNTDANGCLLSEKNYNILLG